MCAGRFSIFSGLLATYVTSAISSQRVVKRYFPEEVGLHHWQWRDAAEFNARLFVAIPVLVDGSQAFQRVFEQFRVDTAT